MAGADLWDRVTKPLKTALDTAAMSMEMVDQVSDDTTSSHFLISFLIEM